MYKLLTTWVCLSAVQVQGQIYLELLEGSWHIRKKL